MIDRSSYKRVETRIYYCVIFLSHEIKEWASNSDWIKQEKTESIEYKFRYLMTILTEDLDYQTNKLFLFTSITA